MAKHRTLPYNAALIIACAIVACITAALTAPPLAALVIMAACIATVSAAARILRMLHTAVLHIDHLEKRGSDRG